MKTATYKLSGETAQERGIKGMELKTREAETNEEMLTLVKDGKEEYVRNAAQSAIDIRVQAAIRAAAEDDVTLAILQGGKVTDEQDAEYAGDYGSMDEAERRELIQTRLQSVSDAYVFGSNRGTGTGATKATKEKAAKVDAVVAAAAAGNLSPETIEELRKLGFTV